MAIILFLLFLSSSIFLISRARRSRQRRSQQLPLPPGLKGWPLLGNLLQLGSKPHQTLQTLSRIHHNSGLLHLRFGVIDVIVVSSAAAAAQCFRNHDANFNNRPPNSTAKYIAYNSEDLVMAPYGARWRVMRKLCAQHLFSSKALDDFRSVREEELGRLVGELSKKSTVVDVFGVVNSCATNILARVLVGRRVLFDGGEEADQFMEMVGEATRLAGMFNIGDFLPWIHWLDLQGVASNMKKIHQRFDKFFEKILTEHRLKPKNFKSADNFLSALIETKTDVEGEHDKLTDTNIKALLQDMFIAGMEPTSITVEWTLAELIRNPDLLTRAQHELDSVVGPNRLVSELDLPNLPYLQAIIKETFRLHPAAPLSVPRIANEDCEVDGYLIPKGATLLVNIWAIGRDPVSWPDDPLVFQPNRFLPGGQHADVDSKGNDFELITFGAGRRICAGMSLALRFVLLMTAMLVHAFDWILADDLIANKLDMEEAYGATLRKKNPLVAHPVPRLPDQAYI